jgi:hypothetical protein
MFVDTPMNVGGDSTMVQPHRGAMAARGGQSYLLGTFEDSRWP